MVLQEGSLRSAEGEPPNPDKVATLEIDWGRWWTVVPEIVAFACAGALPLLIVINVVSRYTDWFRVPWALNIIHVLFIWVVFVGGALAVKYDVHVRMTTLLEQIVKIKVIGRPFAYVIRVSPAAMGAILLVLGISVVKLDMFRLLTWLQIPIGYFAVIIPVSGALMIFYTAQSFYRFMRRQREAESAGRAE